MEENGTRAATPPYLALRTFLGLLDRMNEHGVPSRIDRTYLRYQDGATQTQLIAALKFFGLVDDEMRPQEELVKLVEKFDERPSLIGALIREHYPQQVALGLNATEGQLAECFPGLSGATKRKAITFFLKAAEYGNVKLSPHFRPPRATGTTSGSRPATRAKRNRTARTSTVDPPLQPEVVYASTGAETREIHFGEAGKVTITATVKWFDLPTDTMVKLRKLVDDLEALGTDESTDDEGSDDA